MGKKMSRRKQTNPNKVLWEQVFAGLGEHARQAMMKNEFPGPNGDEQNAMSSHLEDPDLSSSESEADEDNTVDETSSPNSEEDMAVLAVKKEMDMTTTQVITEENEHSSAVSSPKSYLCPECGRGLSSPGSLGRHLLIHSEDQLSNCAVCGARFSNHSTFNSEKLPEVLTPQTWTQNISDVSSSSDTHDMNFSAVYPAGILLVCNNCVAYRKLIEEQTPSMRKWAVRRQNEPVDLRLQRLERERTAKKSRRDSETPEEREVRRMRDREAKRLQRMQETDEQRARRLQRDREAMRQKRANETPEKRQARLIREREAKRLKRRLEKMDMMLRAQFGQDPSAMAALAAEMNFFQIPVNGTDLDNQLLGKMAFEEQSSNALH